MRWLILDEPNYLGIISICFLDKKLYDCEDILDALIFWYHLVTSNIALSLYPYLETRHLKATVISEEGVHQKYLGSIFFYYYYYYHPICIGLVVLTWI